MGKTKINSPRHDRMPYAFYVAAMPTDAVDAKKKYTLAYIKPQPEPTPVTPE